MHGELTTYKRNMDTILPDLRSLEKVTVTISHLVGAAEAAVAAMKFFNKTADQASEGIDNTKIVLGVLGFVSPLKAPTKILQKALKSAEKPVDEVDKKSDALSGKEDGKYLENLEANLANVSLSLAVARDSINLKIWQLETASAATGEFRQALPVALREGEDWSGKYDALNDAVEAQMKARNDLYSPVVAFYEDVKTRVDSFFDVLEVIDFEAIFGEIIDLAELKKVFDFLEKPLEIAQSLIAPIQPLLNAIDAFVSLIVDPIIDYITETLKIDRLLDKVEEQIAKLLPSIDLLDKFLELADELQSFVLEYINDFMGTIDFLDEIEAAFFEATADNATTVGEADDGKGPTGWDDDLINILEGDEGQDILTGLDGRDTIRGLEGDDILIGGEGNDELDGGAGDDLFFFSASFAEYELARDGGNIIVNHLRPSDPDGGTGIDVLVGPLDDHDNVVFSDFSFTGEQLNNALFGGSILNGNANGNLMFLDSSGTPVADFHEANGLGGNDTIFGSIQNDRLNGNSGDDVLQPGLGDDIANGGSGNDVLFSSDGNDTLNGGTGRDTFQVFEGVRREFTVDLGAGTAFGQGQDSLSSIENVVASPDQNHEIQGNEARNYLSTGDSIDVISGRDGDDTIDAGGEDDYVIGGQGADYINAGEGRNAMISGSTAQEGVSDVYIGGSGLDLVSYTSVSNTIKFDFNDQSDDPRILQTLKRYMENLPASGPVEIRGSTGEIARFDGAGSLVTIDRTEGVEAFMGSDMDDLLLGAPAAEWLHGAGGNDRIRTGGSEQINGGSGDDIILAENADGGAKAVQVEGGSGFDVLDLRGVGEARWFYKLEASISLQLKAFEATREGKQLTNEGNAFFSIKPRGIEQILFGEFADHISYRPGGSSEAQFFLGRGDDFFQAFEGQAEVFAGAGNDEALFNEDGTFWGQGGDDVVNIRASGDVQAFMGAGRDMVNVARMDGRAQGDSGFDTILFTPFFSSRMIVDLEEGTARSVKGTPSGFDLIDMTLDGFEEVILTQFDDSLTGSGRDEQVLGRAGRDTLDGGGGQDRLFGGQNADSIDGGKGDDLLHGGLGNDTLVGGAGRDTASYAWARPDGEDGQLIADIFSGVSVDLALGTASGGFGNDVLIGIENVFGSGGNDVLSGNAGSNVLAGEDGNDLLAGGKGSDVLMTGRGADVAHGGRGNDTIVVGLGEKQLTGGRGIDVLDFGTVGGHVTINFATGTYHATFKDMLPRWSNLDTDADGKDDSSGQEARVFNGTALTPQEVLEADPKYANSSDDTSRLLPGEDDPEFENFLITLGEADTRSSGEFSGFEKVVGGESGARIILTSGIDRFDGRVSSRDVIDLSKSGQAIAYNLRSGENNVSLLEGDEITGIDGILGGGMRDRLIGGKTGNQLEGRGGADTLDGAGGRDTLNGGSGGDNLKGGAGADQLRGGRGQDTLNGGSGADHLLGQAGQDTLIGGKGGDVFIFRPGDGADLVRDFDGGRDMLDLSGHGVARLREVRKLSSQEEDGLRIDFGGGDSVLLKGVFRGDLSQDDFIFS